MPTLLYLSEKTHPILREIMPEVKDFNDPYLHESIANMRYSILPNQLKQTSGGSGIAAGMAANQWGIKLRVFLSTPDGSTEDKKCEVMINPSYVPHLQPGETEPTLIEDYEGCFSVPLGAGMVRRYQAIVATYYDVTGKKIERIMEDWEARVFQHETDHLDGKLYDGKLDHFAGPECTKRFLFSNYEEMKAFWEKTVVPSREENNRDYRD